MVQAKVVPIMKMAGPPNMQIAQSQNVQIAATQIAPPATLTSMKQVPYTDQGGETWLEVSGTGTCDYTIQGAGLAVAEFTSSSAKPFPRKVKAPSAPTGSYNWTATGKGSCKGYGQRQLNRPALSHKRAAAVPPAHLKC
ncbi:MAG: hypothetical protein JWN73_20 [Betaproteobacteria bacterium]|nr:hypothetical protein [Betaproteobacteria bacterium]